MGRLATAWVLLVVLGGCEGAATSTDGGALPDGGDVAAVSDSLAADGGGQSEVAGGACDDLPPRPRPAVCLTDGSDLGDELFQGFERELLGTVRAVGEGLPDGCFYGGAGVGGAHDLPGYARSWFRLRHGDDEEEWTVGVQVPDGATVDVRVGDLLSVEARIHEEPFGPSVGNVLIQRWRDELVLWLGEGGAVTDLTPPDGLRFERGDEVCRESDDCGEWALYDLRLVVGESAAVIGYAEQVGVNQYHVVHAGARWQTSPETQCMDWFVAHVSALLTVYSGMCIPGELDCPAPLRCLDGDCRDRPPACGDPPPDPACRSDLEGAECTAHGGDVVCSHLDPELCWCVCESGDGGCPCWHAYHCQGRCQGDEDDCEATVVGTCSADAASAELGCFCIADSVDLTGFHVICAD